MDMEDRLSRAQDLCDGLAIVTFWVGLPAALVFMPHDSAWALSLAWCVLCLFLLSVFVISRLIRSSIRPGEDAPSKCALCGKWQLATDCRQCQCFENPYD